MKILLIHIYFTEKYNSGVDPIAFGTYNKLKADGHEVYFFSLDEKPYYDENYQYSQYFIESHLNGDKSKYNKNRLYNFEAKQKMEKLLDEIKPDLVHIHTIHEISSSVFAPIKKRKIPIIYTAHDIGMFCPAAFVVGKNYCQKCSGLNTLPQVYNNCNKCWHKSIYNAFRCFVERLLGAFRFDLYLTVSQATKDYISQMGLSKDKIKVLPNFITDDFLSKSRPNEEAGKYFFYAGGNNSIKGINTLLQALTELPKDICVHLAGSGYDERIQESLKDMGLSNVKIVGAVNKEEMRKEYENCISAIMPSEWFETFGMVNIEAAAHKKPSIGAKIGGIPEIIEHDKTGLLFESGNVEQLNECILKYWNNRELAVEHGKNAYQKAMNNYTEEIYFEKLTNIYEEIVNGKSFGNNSDI